MANPLTGDYEAVLQVAIRQITGVLTTLHHNGVQPDNPMTMPHSDTGRLGDPRRPPDAELADEVFAEWVNAYQRRAPARGLADLQKHLIATVPPGAARLLSEAFTALRKQGANEIIPQPDVARGLVKLQLSAVTLAVPPGSSSEVTITAAVRARYYPDQGAADLPAPIHGMVQAALRIRRVNTGAGPKLLILPSTDDSKIQFIPAPGSGLGAAEQNRLSVEVRKALRESMAPSPPTLPRDFPFSVFKWLGSGASQVVALPFQLSGAPEPASGVQPLTQSFIGGSGFAIAISAGYVSSLIDVEAIRQAMAAASVSITIRRWTFSVTVTYRLRFTSGPTLTFKSGGIEISGTVAAETSTWWAPNGFVSFRQTVRLLLDTSSQTVMLVRVGDPQVDHSWFIPRPTAVNIVRAQIDDAVDANTPAVRSTFSDGKAALRKGVRTFDPFASVSYTGLEITPDGVIVRGEIGSLPRHPPIVQIGETEHGSAFTAFDSWIPGGRIDRFIWSWVEHRNFSVLGGVEKTLADEHRFIVPKPAGATQLGQICLRIEGAQIMPSGQTISVAAGTTCHVPEPEFALDVPSSWGPLTLPVWQPDVADTDVLRNAIAAHVSVNSDPSARQTLARNALVYFADWRSERPLDGLHAALSKVRNRAALMAIVVAPAEIFNATRRELAPKLAPGDDLGTVIHLTEDDEGGWTRMFAVGKTPSAYLINARRELVWKHEGELDPAVCAAALDRYLTPTPKPSFRPLRLAILPGDLPPHAWLEADDREQFSLQRLRGREVLVNFWQSWSAPCLAELARLQRLVEAGKGTPVVVALHGGASGEPLADIRKRLGLTFILVQDREQAVARMYGVRCWPTTIAFGADGRAQHIQYGCAHEHGRAGGDKEARRT